MASGTGIGFTCGVLSNSRFTGLTTVSYATSAGLITGLGVELNAGSAAAELDAAASAPELAAAAWGGFFGAKAASDPGGMTTIVLVAAFFSLVS